MKQRQLRTDPLDYPSGTFVHTEKGYFFIANDHKRFRCITKRVMESWAPQRVVETTEAAVSAFRVSAKLRFRNGSLIHSISDGKIYLISDGYRRHIQNPDWFENLGAVRDRNNVQAVSLDEINLHPEGEPLV